jgi:putative peptidoglycan lipid II flippase
MSKYRNKIGKNLYNSFLIGVFTSLGFAGSFFRDYLMAKFIGFRPLLDSYYLVMMLPMFFVSIFCIPFGYAIIPKLEELKKLSLLRFNHSINYFSYLSIAICFSLCLVTYFISSNLFYLLHYIGWTKEIIISNTMLLMVLPILFLSGLVIVSNSLLLIKGHYYFPSLVQLLVPIFAILSIIVYGSDYGTYAVIVATIIGQTINFLLNKRLLTKENIYLFPLRFKNTIIDRKNFWIGYAHLIVIAVFANTAVLVNTLMASTLGGGAVSIYNLGSKITLFISGILTSIFVSILLPYFSKLSASRGEILLNQKVSSFTIIASIISIPFSVIFFLNSELISFYVFSNIASDRATLLGIASVMKYSIIQLPFWIANFIFLRHANSTNKIQIIVLIISTCFLINIFLNLYLIQFMNVGGLSLGSTISTAIASGLILLNYVYNKTINFIDAILISISWLFFVLIVIAVKFNWFFIEYFAIMVLLGILFLKFKRINSSKYKAIIDV